MVNIKYTKNPGNVHSIKQMIPCKSAAGKSLFEGSFNKFEIYVQNGTQHLIILNNDKFLPHLPFSPLRAFLGKREERRVGLKV